MNVHHNVSAPFGDPLLRDNDVRTRFSFFELISHRVGFSCGKSILPACLRGIPHEESPVSISRTFPVVDRRTPPPCGAKGLPETLHGHTHPQPETHDAAGAVARSCVAFHASIARSVFRWESCESHLPCGSVLARAIVYGPAVGKSSCPAGS